MGYVCCYVAIIATILEYRNLSSNNKLSAMATQYWQSGSFQEVVARKSSGRRVVNILTTGKLAAGKSALINGLVGEEVAPESNSLYPETTEVQKYSRNIDGIMFNVWDSPGIEANTENEEANMQKIAKKLKEVDLLLFCIRMDEARLRKQDSNTLIHFTSAFGEDVWRHTVFVLTFANSVFHPRTKHDPSATKEFFDKRLQNWKKEIRDALIEAGVDRRVTDEIPIIPAGYKDQSLPGGRENWLTEFWSVCLQMMKDHAQPALLKVNINRLRSAQEVVPDDYQLPLHHQPKNVDMLYNVLIILFGVIGFVAGAIMSGPVGLMVSGVAGAMVGYLLQRNMTNLHVVIQEQLEDLGSQKNTTMPVMER